MPNFPAVLFWKAPAYFQVLCNFPSIHPSCKLQSLFSLKVVVKATMTDQASSYRWIEGQGHAFGQPGAELRWTSSTNAAVGMAYSAASRIWYTISHGVLNE